MRSSSSFPNMRYGLQGQLYTLGGEKYHVFYQHYFLFGYIHTLFSAQAECLEVVHLCKKTAMQPPTLWNMAEIGFLTV